MRAVGEASHGRQLVEMFRQHNPDATLIDLRMRLLNGVEAVHASILNWDSIVGIGQRARFIKRQGSQPP